MPGKLSPTQVAFNARGDGKFSQTFIEQSEFFRQKFNFPTDKWDDILHEAHDRAFIVAGAAKADLLDDLHQAVQKSITDGKSIQWFRKEFDAIVDKHGWEGWTGSETKAGRAWRTRVIYQTNISTSYAAGRYQQLTDPELLKLRPNWEYRHSDSVRHPRPLHVSWSGTILPADDPWFHTHFPPNGFLCHCRIAAVGKDKYNPPPDDGNYIYKDKKGGEHTLPKGVDYGFGYTPGRSVAKNMQPFIDNKIASLPTQLGKALKSDIANRAKQITDSVSDSLTLPKSGIAKTATAHALKAIDKLHNVENLPSIPVKNSSSVKFQGQYSWYPQSGQPNAIAISTASVNPPLIAAHEIGHFLDNQVLGKQGTYASVSDALFKNWRTAIEESIATKALKDLKAQAASSAAKKRVAYYLSLWEQWARSYAQWVATRSDDATLIEQVKKIVQNGNSVYAASQWTDQDFEPIANAIDEIFKTLGWLK